MRLNIQCIDPFRTFSEGRKPGAKWVDGAKWVEMVRNGSISEFQNFSNEKLPIATEIGSVWVLLMYIIIVLISKMYIIIVLLSKISRFR